MIIYAHRIKKKDANTFLNNYSSLIESGKVILHFDDGYRCLYETIIRDLIKAKLPFNIGLNSSILKGFNTKFEDYCLQNQLDQSYYIAYKNRSLSKSIFSDFENWQSSGSVAEYFSLEELRQIGNYPKVKYINHGLKHYPHRNLSPKEEFTNIFENEKELVDMLGAQLVIPRSFIYPYGSFSRITTPILKMFGIKLYGTDNPGRNGIVEARYRIPNDY